MSHPFARHAFTAVISVAALCFACGSDQKTSNTPDNVPPADPPADTSTPSDATAAAPNGEPTNTPPAAPPPQSLNDVTPGNALGVSTLPSQATSIQAELAKSSSADRHADSRN